MLPGKVNPHVETTLGSGSGVTAATYYYFDMDEWRYFALQLILTVVGVVTITVQATVQDDGTAAASIPAANWFDVTNSWFGAASFLASDILERDTPVAVKYVRVKVVTTNVGDAWTLYLKRTH